MSIVYQSGNYDTVVVGARCAGAATAMLMARHGGRILLVDRAKEGSDTLSTQNCERWQTLYWVFCKIGSGGRLGLLYVLLASLLRFQGFRHASSGQGAGHQ